MDRFWFLTWTTYGNWLPGDSRGFVGKLRDEHGLPFLHNLPGTPYDADNPALERAMRAAMKGDSIRLSAEQAPILLDQFRETATYRDWQLLAVAIMSNHVHLVTGVRDDPEPKQILHSFKSYGSRALNRQWSKPVNGTWWVESGSKRKLADQEAVRNAVKYVRDQEYPLLVWLSAEAEAILASGGSYAPGNVAEAGASPQEPGA